jgi:hypothetical protein
MSFSGFLSFCFGFALSNVIVNSYNKNNNQEEKTKVETINCGGTNYEITNKGKVGNFSFVNIEDTENKKNFRIEIDKIYGLYDKIDIFLLQDKYGLVDKLLFQRYDLEHNSKIKTRIRMHNLEGHYFIDKETSNFYVENGRCGYSKQDCQLVPDETKQKIDKVTSLALCLTSGLEETKRIELESLF